MGKIEEEREELVGVDAQINERKLECPLGCRRAGFNCAEVPSKIFVWEEQIPIAPHLIIHVVLIVEVMLWTRQAEGHVVDIDSRVPAVP